MPQSLPKEEIAIIGGGLAGCLAALFAARVKDDQGNPRYHITLYEADPALLNGASLTAARLHLGGEYPLDPQTGLDCLKGALIWKLLMPTRIYTQSPPMKFLVAEETENEGRLSVRNYIDYYESLRKEYEKLFNQIKQRRQWTREAAAQKLFGVPDKGRFYRPLSARDLSHFEHIAGGFASQEPGLDVPLYLAVIEHLIHKEQSKGHITIMTGCRIEKKGIISEPDGRFRLRLSDGRMTRSFNQVIQAAWESGPAITRLGKKQKVTSYRRGMGEFSAANVDSRFLQPFFVMLGEHGCMFCPGLGNDAFCYAPGADASHIDQKTLTARNPEIPNDWQRNFGKEEESRRLEAIKQRLCHVAPFLHSLIPAKLLVRQTLNFQDTLEQRRHEPAKEKKPGLIVLYPTKLTLAPQAALEAVETLKARSAGRMPEPIDALEVAMTDESYSLARAPLPNRDALLSSFLHAHEDLDALMDQPRKRSGGRGR